MKKIKTKYLIQGAFFLLAIFIALRHQIEGALTAAPIDTYCPFGTMESLYTLIVTGEFVKRTYVANLIVSGAVLVMIIFVGKAFCGYICPFGTLQEWIYKLTGKIWKRRRFSIPSIIDKPARYLKYILLVVILYFSWTTADLFFHSYDPFVAFMHFGRELEDLKWAYLILGLTVISSFFIEKLWCRYFCPLGAIQAVFTKLLSLFSLQRNNETCTTCKLCTNNCPVGLDIHSPEVLKNPECHACLDCVDVCPKTSLTPAIAGKKVSKKLFPLIVTGIFLGIIGLNVLLGFWQTRKPITFTDATGKVNTAEIRGSYTLATVVEQYHVTAQQLEEEIGIPFSQVDEKLMLKDIWTTYPKEITPHDFYKKYGVEIEDTSFETEHFRAVLDYIIKNNSEPIH